MPHRPKTTDGHGREQVDDVAEALRETSRGVVRDEQRHARARAARPSRGRGAPPRWCRTAAARRSPRSWSVSSEASSLSATERGDRLDDQEDGDGGERHEDHRSREEGRAGEPAGRRGAAWPSESRSGAAVVGVMCCFLIGGAGCGPGPAAARPAGAECGLLDDVDGGLLPSRAGCRRSGRCPRSWRRRPVPPR